LIFLRYPFIVAGELFPECDLTGGGFVIHGAGIKQREVQSPVLARKTNRGPERTIQPFPLTDETLIHYQKKRSGLPEEVLFLKEKNGVTFPLGDSKT